MTDIVFQPVRGTESAISRMPKQDGRVYFAYDTGKIYLDKENVRYLMSSTSAGSSSGFAWADGSDENIIKENEDEASNTYLIYPAALIDQTLPKLDSLVLNSDGRFFHVIEVHSDYVIGELIAVSGTGGGGTVVSEQDVFLSYDDTTIASGFTYIYGQTSYAKFSASATNDPFVTLSFVITQKGEQIESFSERINSGATYLFDTARLPKGNDITITVKASSVNSNMGNNDSRIRRIIDNINTVELKINKDNSFQQSAIRTGEVGIPFIPVYNGLNQTLHVLIDDEINLNLDENTNNSGFKLWKPTGSTTYTVIIPEQTHGAHNIKLRVSTVISGNTLYSDYISYDLAWKNVNSNVPIIWFGEYETNIINYNECVIPFMVYDPEKEANSTKTKVYITQNGSQIPTSPMEVSYNAASWIRLDVTNLYEAGDGVGKENIFGFTCGNTTESVTIYVTTEGARDLGLVNTNSLFLNLSSVGRSNNETSTSRNNWKYAYKPTMIHEANFKNFNWYNNGWLNDNDGNGSYLSVANGASLDVNFAPPTITLCGLEFNYSFEIRFRVRNIQEYSTLIKTIPYYYVNENDKTWTLAQIAENHFTIAVDSDGNARMDKASPKTISSTAGVIFKYLNSQGYGFCIGTQEAYFRTSSGIANVRYKEDEIINLSFVISKTSGLMSIYLNGILSGALDLEEASSFSMDNDKFEITSEFCDVDIFKLRVYNTELSMPDVVHNYISDIHDVQLYDQNQLTDTTDGTILLYSKLLDYNAQYPDNPSMPYAVWEIIDNGSGYTDPNNGPHGIDDDKLPYFKGNNRYCKITFVNPSLDLAYKKGLIDDNTYKKRSPSYVGIGVDINVQGTSSQAYPRRNFKTKFKSATNKVSGSGNNKVTHDEWGWFYTGGPYADAWTTWETGKDSDGRIVSEEDRITARESCRFKKWYMDNNVCSTNKFTWKIDYMESSGTYNTGFANLVGNSIYDYHPLSRVAGLSTDGQGFRTSVYGFPVMVFHKHSTAADQALDDERQYLTYEYIGRYNLNLDKSSNEFYGFELDDIHPFIEDETAMADVAECWELRDNQGTWTSFKYPGPQERLTRFGTLTAEGMLEVGKHFEPRYNNEADQIDYCRGVESAESLGYTDITKIEMADGSLRDLSTTSAKNAYLREKFTNLEKLFDWLDSTDTTAVPSDDTGVPLEAPQTFNNSVSYMVETIREDGADVVYFVDSSGEKLVKVIDVTEEDDQKFYVYMENGENIMERAIAPAGYTGTVRTKDDTLITYNTDCAGYRLKKFVKEFNQHLDLEYCLIYFIMTELLLCYDSRGKNMMIASWGPQAEWQYTSMNINPNNVTNYYITNDNGRTYIPATVYNANTTYYKREKANYVWYPIFYDIDTQLGLNNIGAVLWDYDTDATIQGTFSTANSVLWQNFFNGFRKNIEEKYRQLRKSSRLTERTIEGAYLCDPDVFSNSYAMRGVRPVIALGLDEWYKYIAPGKRVAGWYSGTDRRYGFYVQSFDNGNSKTTDLQYVYTCQGDRKLSRELFIRNRLNYLDSWWLAGAYDSTSSGYKTEIMIRANANDTSTSDTYLDESKVTSDVIGYTRTTYPKKFYDAVPEFTITPFLSQYVTVFYDEDPLTPTIKYDGINSVITHTTPSVENGYRAIHPYNEQLTYIPGGDFLSDLGDLSLKYPSHFKLSTGKRLVQLLIGSDAPGYANGIIGKEAGTFDLNDSASSTNKKGLLQKIVLTGLTALSMGQNVSGSEKLREFRALNTVIPSVTFADGSPLDTVHLPKSITEINLVHAKNLNNILRNYPVVMIPDNEEGYVYNDLNAYKGLYIEGLTDWDKNNTINISNIRTLNLIDVNMGYDSYVLLDNAIDIRERFRPNDFLGFNFENVNWCPYTVIESDTEFDSSIQFYLLTDHNTFIPYNKQTDWEFNQNEWDLLKLNNKLFTYDSTTQEHIIPDISLLQTIINDCKNATNVATNHYRATNGAQGITKPNISGIMYISNENGSAIPETDSTSGFGIKELQTFFTNLKIYAAKVNESNIVKYIYRHDGIDEEIDLIRYEPSIIHPNSISNKLFTRNNYDFIGWSTEDPEVNPNAPLVLQFDNNIISENNSDKYHPVYQLVDTTNTPFDENMTYYVLNNDEYSVANVNSSNYTSMTLYINLWNNLKFNDNLSTITLFARYIPHPYNINYNVDGQIFTRQVPYGDRLGAPDFVPYKDATNLSLKSVYIFRGWAREVNGEPLNTTNLENRIVDSNLTLYAVFAEGSVYDNVLSDEYFNIRSVTFNSNTFYMAYPDIQSSAKNRSAFKGKITIPKTIIKNNVEYQVGGFGRYSTNTQQLIQDAVLPDVTHVFFEPGSNMQYIGPGAFWGWTNLRYVELLNENVSIEQSAFSNLPNLFKDLGDNTQNYMDLFFDKIIYIGDYAFNSIGLTHTSIGQATEEERYLKTYEIKLPNLEKYTSNIFMNFYIKGISFGSTTNHLSYSWPSYIGTPSGVVAQSLYQNYNPNDLQHRFVISDLTFYYNGEIDGDVAANIVTRIFGTAVPENNFLYDINNTIYQNG